MSEREVLRGELERSAARRDATQRVAVSVLVLAIIAVFIIQLVLVAQTRNQSETNAGLILNQDRQAAQRKQLTEDVKDLLARQLDCTTPEGKCYQEQIALSAKQTGQVNAWTRTAAICLYLVPEGQLEKFERCLENRNRRGLER